MDKPPAGVPGSTLLSGKKPNFNRVTFLEHEQLRRRALQYRPALRGYNLPTHCRRNMRSPMHRSWSDISVGMKWLLTWISPRLALPAVRRHLENSRNSHSNPLSRAFLETGLYLQ
jgi:hypothetical protein